MFHAGAPRSPLSLPHRLVVIGLLLLTSILTMGAGGPFLLGSQPGDLPVFPEFLIAEQHARQLPAVSAPAILLGDSTTGQILATVAPHDARAMASTTKIMTALLVLERANLSDAVTVPPEALIGGSTMNLSAGEVLSVEQLLWGLLINSGNDAALTLAIHLAGSETGFVALMNERAAQLGMANTHFANPHGLDAPGHVSSAYDLWLVTQAALQYPLFRQIVATPSITIAGHPLLNTNELLTTLPGADGVKTGTTDLAGQCLVASVSDDAHRTVAVILGSGDRFSDARQLFEHSATFWPSQPAPQPIGPTGWLRTSDGLPLHVVAADPPTLNLAAWLWPQLRSQVVLNTTERTPGQTVGTIRWYLGNRLLGEAPAVLVAY